MKRKVVMGVLIAVCTLLQCGAFQLIEVASIRPNLLLILTVSFALMCGRKSGMMTGFFCGLCQDLFFEKILGFNALLYLWVGYAAGYFCRIFYDDDIKTPLFMVAAADLGYGVIRYIFTFLLRGRLDFFFYLRRIIIPEALYTCLLTIVTYRLFYHINRKLSGMDGRSLDDFA